MSHENGKFFTVIDCMDGRVQKVVAEFGQEEFNAQYPDTITDAGIAGKISNNPTSEYLGEFKFKLVDVSLGKHNSVGVLVGGHQKCAGDPVEDEVHKDHIRSTVVFVKDLVQNKVPVVGVFVVEENNNWVVKKV